MAGDVMFVDPAITPVSGEFVLAKQHGVPSPVVRRYIHEDRGILLAERQGWPEQIQYASSFSIIGTILCSVRSLHS